MTRSKDWEPYKDEILRLWIVEGLTLDQVSLCMSENHGFHQEKFQYEYRLKQWGVHKKFSSRIWRSASLAIGKSQTHQQNFQFVLKGVPISRSRARRALQRNAPDVSLAHKYKLACSPQPPADHALVMTSPTVTETFKIDWPKSLPWIQFQKESQIVAPLSSDFMYLLAQASCMPGFLRLSAEIKPLELARTLFTATTPTSSTSSPIEIARMLPQMPSTLEESNTLRVLEKPHRLSALFLENLLFQWSNKMSQSTWIPEEECKEQNMLMLKLVHEQRRFNSLVFDSLMASAKPTSKAIKETLYKAAIQLSDIEVVSQLWKAGTDLNVLVPLTIDIQFGDTTEICRGASLAARDQGLIMQSTALQYAASTCNVALAFFLIDAGAKADFGSPTPLQILSSMPKHPDTVQFADLLLRQGARWDQHSHDMFPPLLEAAACRNKDLVRFFIQKGVQDLVVDEVWPDSGRGIFRLQPFPYVTGRHEYLLNVSNQPREQKVTALQFSIMTNDIESITMLIDAVMNQSNRIEILRLGLMTACLSGDENTVQKLLRLDIPMLHDQKLINSAFCSIAWIMDCRIANLLMHHGAFPFQFTDTGVSILQLAALYGNSSLIELLVSCGFNVHSGSELLFTPFAKTAGKEIPPSIRGPLECAVRMGRRAAAETLLGLGADVGDIALEYLVELGSTVLLDEALQLWHEDIIGVTVHELQIALEIAIECGKGIAVVRRLLDVGAIVEGHELVAALRSGDQEVVQLLIGRGADLLATGRDGETVLEAAYRVGNYDLARYFFICGGVYDSKAMLLAVHRAVTEHSYQAIEDLVAVRPVGPIDEFEATCFVLAIRTANSFLVEIFLRDAFKPSPALSIYCWHSDNLTQSFGTMFNDKHPNINLGGINRHECSHRNCPNRCSPMLIALRMAQVQLIRRMISCGHGPDIYLLETMYEPEAIDKNVKRILEANFPMASLSHISWHCRLLMAAIRHSADIKSIRQHLSKLQSLEFSIHRADRLPRSPLPLAVDVGDIDCVKAILEASTHFNGISVEMKSAALGLALLNRDLDIASLLLEHGANINDNADLPPLVQAAMYGDLELAVFLVEHGADVNAKHRGLTGLEAAAKQGRIDMADFLLSHGIDISGRERIHFVRAVNSAVRACHYATANLLKERGEWTEEDIELAQMNRATDLYHSCPRFRYGDASLEGCHECPNVSYSHSTSNMSQLEDSTASSSVHVMEEENELAFNIPETSLDDSLMMEDEWQASQTAGWTFRPYTAMDREGDDLGRTMIEEYEENMMETSESQMVPFAI